jgi:hypothetical protein
MSCWIILNRGKIVSNVQYDVYSTCMSVCMHFLDASPVIMFADLRFGLQNARLVLYIVTGLCLLLSFLVL